MRIKKDKVVINMYEWLEDEIIDELEYRKSHTSEESLFSNNSIQQYMQDIVHICVAIKEKEFAKKTANLLSFRVLNGKEDKEDFLRFSVLYNILPLHAYNLAVNENFLHKKNILQKKGEFT